MDRESFLPGNDLAPPSLLRRIFIGGEGIRAGWSISIFLVLMGILTALFLVPTNSLLGKYGLSPGDAQPVPAGAGELAGFLGLLGASMMMARIEHRPLISYGLEGSRRFKAFSAGVISGFGAPFIVDRRIVPRRESCLRRSTSSCMGSSGICVELGGGVSSRRVIRGIPSSGVPSGNPCAGNRILVECTRSFGPLWVHASLQPGRIADRHLFRGSRRVRLLSQSMVPEKSLVGDRVPCFVGLGAVVFLGDGGQRKGARWSSLFRASAGEHPLEWRDNGAGRKHPRYSAAPRHRGLPLVLFRTSIQNAEGLPDRLLQFILTEGLQAILRLASLPETH